ncbi:MAG: hypothetical protein NTY19_38010 [Planctomycetota bacterium]|nr:hypothetical protein [Planctomycetota bacterium]
MAISFLAGFAGLGNVADKIRGVIGKVRASVDKAIDIAIAWIVAKTKALIGTVTSGVKQLFEWWKKKQRFSAGDESHEPSFRGELPPQRGQNKSGQSVAATAAERRPGYGIDSAR